jgi:predicted extracellular nuclease
MQAPPMPVTPNSPINGNAIEGVQIATFNVRNLANAGRVFYLNEDAYSASEFERKISWLGDRFKALNADVIAVQEVWDEAALKAAVHRSHLRYETIIAPGAENHSGGAHDLMGTPGGAQGTPRVGFVTRLKLIDQQSFRDFPQNAQVEVPEVGTYKTFDRPPLMVHLQTKQGHTLKVLTAHLKSKRPKFLQDAAGAYLEDREDPYVLARAQLRALVMRGAEAVAMRSIVIKLLKGSNDPLVVMGDFNDGPHSVTTQMIAATSEVAYDRASRDFALFNAYELQTEASLKKDLSYSHVFQGYPEVLDQILVSEEFVKGAKFAIGDVRRVDYFNDHLHEGRDRCKSDHGIGKALIRFF